MPVIKEGGWDRSGKSLFDLLGYDERALTNAFAYLLARNRHFYFEFMRKLDDEITWGKKNYRKVEIFTEHQRGNGRTDLEILKTDEYDC